ncbi:MAG: hypothetical protein ACREPE_03295 [Lysobacter sp.]
MLRPLLLAALCFATACTPLNAAPLVDLAVVDRDSGEWLADVHHRGQRWIAGTPGHRYGVRLTNTSGERVLVVLSIDGVNAVTGQTAHPSQAGYVLEPWQSTEIAGWRKSYEDIAQFVFTDLPDSYAARTGRPNDVGVIGIAVFAEARAIRYDYPQGPPVAGDARAQRNTGKAAAPAASAATESMAQDQAAQRMGTGHGEREWSPVSRTGFVRASRHPTQVSQLRYDDYGTLVARGVMPRDRRHWEREHGPRAFPNGFVADPPPRW